jgi:hypothetical protein
MIVRKEADGTLLLIAQTDHSQLVGEIGSHWGNDHFAVPMPFESVARAATFHDFGWLRYETAPIWDAESGETPGFRQIPGSAAQLEAYEWCYDWLLRDDPYAGLIVSTHRTGLWRGRYDAIDHPPHPIRPLAPAVENFAAKAEARQAEERKSCDPQELWTNYRLLQVWDLLGLYFSCQDPFDEYIDPVPTRYGAAKNEGVRMTLKPVTSRKVSFDPYPFDRRPCFAQLGCKRLPSVSYPDRDAFRRAYFQAATELIEFELI